MIEPYNYNDEPSGRSETLVQALDKCERLEKQLNIAVEALKKYADVNNWIDTETPQYYYPKSQYWKDINAKADSKEGQDGYEDAQNALQQIKELEK